MPPNGVSASAMPKWLILTMPASSPLETSVAVFSELVNTYEARPYGRLLARRSASSASLKRVTGATGPNGSSTISLASSGRSVTTVGAKK